MLKFSYHSALTFGVPRGVTSGVPERRVDADVKALIVQPRHHGCHAAREAHRVRLQLARGGAHVVAPAVIKTLTRSGG